MLTPALGCLGAALSMSLPWPQVYRSVAQGRTTGLSATACFLGVATPLGWITYGLLIGDRLQVVTNTVTGGAGLAILLALLTRQAGLRTARKLALSAGAAAGVLLAALLSAAAATLPGVTGPHVAPLLGGVLAVAATLGAIPQPLSLLRDRTQDLTGISPLRWRLALLACSSWLSYGLLAGQVAVWASALVGLTSAAIVSTVLLTRRPVPAAPAVGLAASAAVAGPAVPARVADLAVPAVPARVVDLAVPAVPARVAAPAVGVGLAAPAGTARSIGFAGTARSAGAARVIASARPVIKGSAPVPPRARVRVPRPADMPTMVFRRDLVAA